MKVMVMVKATKSSEEGILPSVQMLNEMGRYNEELVKAGIMQAGEGLKPTSQGVRVRFSGTKRAVIDGPFTETNELVAGFWLWNVKSMQEAIDWVKRCPNPMLEDSEIEIRPLYEMDDFGENATSEIRDREARLREQICDSAPLVPRMVDAPEFLVAGMNQTYTFADRGKIPEQWMKFVPHLGNIPGQVGHTTFGVCWNYQAGCGFDYLTGVEVQDFSAGPGGFQSVTIPAGRYAVFTHAGHYSQLPATFEAIHTKWLPTSGKAAAHSPSFERYTEEFNPETGMGGTEVWIPLQAT